MVSLVLLATSCRYFMYLWTACRAGLAAVLAAFRPPLLLVGVAVAESSSPSVRPSMAAAASRPASSSTWVVLKFCRKDLNCADGRRQAVSDSQTRQVELRGANLAERRSQCGDR